MPEPQEVTILLERAQRGDREAANRLLPLVYQELRGVASRAMRRERPGHMLQATALVHEAYLRLFREQALTFENRAHFFGIAARSMRQILVEHARARQAAKRDGGQRPAQLDENVAGAGPRSVDLLALDEALERLAATDERQARIVELRYFGGLSVEETAEALQLSPATIKREWTVARAFLFRELSPSCR